MENPNTVLIAVGVVVVLLVGLIALFMTRSRRSKKLADQFGPEYQRTMEETGKRSKGEKELVERAKRVEKYEIHALTDTERNRFSDLWRTAQGRFVDSPVAAVAEADHLVTEVMRVRGYPMTEFERTAADLSVDHPKVIAHYREAHALALKSHQGQASTEDLRQAMVHYRTLFEDLVEVAEMELVGAR